MEILCCKFPFYVVSVVVEVIADFLEHLFGSGADEPFDDVACDTCDFHTHLLDLHFVVADSPVVFYHHLPQLWQFQF